MLIISSIISNTDLPASFVQSTAKRARLHKGAVGLWSQDHQTSIQISVRNQDQFWYIARFGDVPTRLLVAADECGYLVFFERLNRTPVVAALHMQVPIEVYICILECISRTLPHIRALYVPGLHNSTGSTHTLVRRSSMRDIASTCSQVMKGTLKTKEVETGPTLEGITHLD